MGDHHLSGHSVPLPHHPCCKQLFFTSSRNLPFQSETISPLSHHNRHSHRVCPLFFLQPSLDIERQLSGLPRAFSPPCRTAPALPARPHRGCVPSLGSFLWPSSGHDPTAPHLSCTEDSTSERSTPGEVSPAQSRREGSPSPADHTSDAAQDTVGFLGSEGTVLACVPQALFHRAVLHPYLPYLVLMDGDATPQAQHLTPGSVGSREVHVGSLVELV